MVVLELVCKTPCLRAFREGMPHLWMPMEDIVKCISLEMLFWAGAEAENLNVNQGDTTECRWLRDSDLCDSGLQCLRSVKA